MKKFVYFNVNNFNRWLPPAVGGRRDYILTETFTEEDETLEFSVISNFRDIEVLQIEHMTIMLAENGSALLLNAETGEIFISLT